jgi:Zn-finger nucleic acid-binding protein
MALRCLRDGVALAVADAEGHVGHRCPQCASLWLPAAFLAALARDRGFDLDAFHAKLAAGIEGDSGFACPGGHALARVDYRSLELDWCPTCRGVWFDAGELRRLLDLHPNLFTEEGAATRLVEAGGFALLDIAIGVLS